jgi:hypothetical protein
LTLLLTGSGPLFHRSNFISCALGKESQSKVFKALWAKKLNEKAEAAHQTALTISPYSAILNPPIRSPFISTSSTSDSPAPSSTSSPSSSGAYPKPSCSHPSPSS